MKSQKITPEIQKAISRWYNQSGNTLRELAEKINVEASSLNGWIIGRTSVIRPRNWEQLYPHIKKYLPQGFQGESQDFAQNPPEGWILPDGLLVEFLKLWPQLSVSEQAKVIAFAAETLEKQSRPVQPKILESEGIA